MADFWVIGPIAWDRVLQVPCLPLSGGFVQARGVAGRPGGAGANTAVALASTGALVHMVGYAGDDKPGARLRTVLDAAGVDARFVLVRAGHTSEVVGWLNTAARILEAASSQRLGRCARSWWPKAAMGWPYTAATGRLGINLGLVHRPPPRRRDRRYRHHAIQVFEGYADTNSTFRSEVEAEQALTRGNTYWP